VIHNRSGVRTLALGLAAAGTVIAAYLTVLHYSTAVPLVCSNTGLVNCADVLTSPQSVWLGLPVAGVGLVWFVATLFLWWRSRASAPALWPLRLAWALLGALTVVYLVYVELVELRHLCAWCTVLHAIILTLLVLSILDGPAPDAA
jgi:uncharacterized membrane protein